MVSAPLQVAPPQPHGGQWVWQQEARLPITTLAPAPAAILSPAVPLSSSLSMVFPPAAPVGTLGSIQASPHAQPSYGTYNPYAMSANVLTPPTPPAPSHGRLQQGLAASMPAPRMVSVF